MEEIDAKKDEAEPKVADDKGQVSGGDDGGGKVDDTGDEPVDDTSTLAQPAEDAPLLPPLDVAVATKSSYSDPSMTVSLWITWIIPLILIAVFSRKVVDTTIPTIPVDQSPSRPSAQLKMERKINEQRRQKQKQEQPRSSPTSSSSPPLRDVLQSKNWPNSYVDLVESIGKRRRPVDNFPGGIHSMIKALRRSAKKSNQTTASATVDVDMTGETTRSETSRKSAEKTDSRRRSSSRTRSGGRESDPMRSKYLDGIEEYRVAMRRNPDDIYIAIALAEAMRMYDMQFHEGGTFEQEALALYATIVTQVAQKRRNAVSEGLVTNQSANPNINTVNDEVVLEYQDKSLDGLLCALYTAQGKLFFMANMFERAHEAYSFCLNGVDDNYLDAVNARGSTSIVLGLYEEAGRDFLQVIRFEAQRTGLFFFIEAYTGLARVLEAKEDVVPQGWDSIVDLVHDVIPMMEEQLKLASPQERGRIADSLNRLHHVLFIYHDSKTKNYPEAFDHLTQAFQHKLSVLPPWVHGSEQAKITQTRNIFQRGFWPDGSGSRTRTPIFIIGFVRSGSTLLERILDAHPLIAGTGENSVFNGRLNDIRDQIVEASTSDSEDELADTTRRLANEVVDEMYRRWEAVEANTNKTDESSPRGKPKRLADKMLTNYYNIGFIQLLYPNALILHVAREPMDSVFSAYKHEFPAGSLDYTSDFVGVSDLYIAYRDVMDHWEKALPGRIMHIRYEDMVKDFENVARAVISATGLGWDDSVLQFHKKKHAVNTMSSTQVRKGIYTSSLNSWMRYEKQLRPLVEMLGDRFKYNLKTTLPGYVAKVPTEEE